MDNTSDNVEARISKLEGRVSEYSSNSNSTFNSSSFMSGIPTFASPYIYYSLLPIGICIALYAWKPSFLLENISIDGGYPELRFNYKKLFLAVMVLSVMAGISIYVYFYRKKMQD